MISNSSHMIPQFFRRQKNGDMIHWWRENYLLKQWDIRNILYETTTWAATLYILKGYPLPGRSMKGRPCPMSRPKQWKNRTPSGRTPDRRPRWWRLLNESIAIIFYKNDYGKSINEKRRSPSVKATSLKKAHMEMCSHINITKTYMKGQDMKRAAPHIEPP